MMFFAAEEVVPPLGFASWLACAGFLVFLVDRLISIRVNTRPTPPIGVQLKKLQEEMEIKLGVELSRLEATFNTRMAAIEKTQSATDSYVRHLEMRIFEKLDLIIDKWEARVEAVNSQLESLRVKSESVAGQLRYLEGKTSTRQLHNPGDSR